MEVNSLIFQIEHPLVKEAYTNIDNYKVIYKEGDHVEKDLCAIYFSSNELYYPNTELAFTHSILQKDKFEWQNNLYPRAHKHILLRDIQKQWYVEGINAQYSSPEKLTELLLELTKNYKVYVIGSSAGGFAALLFGNLINAKRVYSFNAQLDLNVTLQKSDSILDPLLYKHLNNPTLSKYYTVGSFLQQHVECFYFQSAKSVMDIEQFEACSNRNALTKIEFSTSNHGFPFLRHDLSYILQLSSDQLKKLSKKRVHPFLLSAKVHGPLQATLLTLSAIRKRISKKLTEKSHSAK